YSKFTSEDQINAGAAVGGTLQPDADTQLVGRMQYLRAHEDRGSSDSVTTNFANPLRYDQFEMAGAINKRYGRVWTSIGGAGAFINFHDPTIAGIPIDQSYRTGTIVRVPARVGYVVAPLTSVFIEGSVNDRNFRSEPFDSTAHRVVGGWLLEPGPGARIKGEIYP